MARAAFAFGWRAALVLVCVYAWAETLAYMGRLQP